MNLDFKRGIGFGAVCAVAVVVLMGSAIAPTAYNLIKNAGSSLTQRTVLNFTGGGCADNSGTTPPETDCAGGGTAGSTLFTYTNAVGTGPSDTNVETSLIGAATTGSKTIAANTMTAGLLLQAVITGQITTPVAADNLTLNMYMGATKVATGTITGAGINSLTAESFTAKVTFFILTGGAACAVLVNDATILTGGLVAGDIHKFQGTGTTYDCTASQAFDFKAQWAAASVGESLLGMGDALYIPGAPVTSVNGQTGAVTVTPFFQTLTAPSSGSFTAQNFNTGAGVTTTQTNNSSPVTSITLDQHDPDATKNIAALDKAVIASKSFTLTEAFSVAPSSGTNAEYCLYLSDGGSPPNIIIYGLQSGSGAPANGVILTAFTFTNFTTFGAVVFQAGPPSGFGPLLWLRIVEDAAHRSYLASSDGINFAQIFQEAVGAHFTTARYGFGLGLQSANAVNADAMETLYSFAEHNP